MERLTYRPVFTGTLKAWTIAHCKRHYWRVRGTMELEDLIQEAAVIFCLVRTKYKEVESAAHFASLYRRTLTNHFNDLASRNFLERVATSDYLAEHPREDQAEQNLGPMLTLLRQAPPALRQLVASVESGVQLNERKQLARARKGARRTTNGKLCTLAGVDASRVNLAEFASLFLEGADAV